MLDLISSSTSEELAWMNGYLNGIVSKQLPREEPVVKSALNKITIAYGTETGNSKKTRYRICCKSKKIWHACKGAKP
ncbi:MAG: hypothetical protein WKF59_02940 [Chitinophagaceae bacterium]